MSFLKLNEANTIDECIDILFQSVSSGVLAIMYEIIVWRTAKLFEFINGLEDIINESE